MTEGFELEPESSSDINGTDDDIVVKTNRRVKVEFQGHVDIEVIEPPQVFDAEIHVAVKKAILSAFAQYRLGTVVGYEIDVTG